MQRNSLDFKSVKGYSRISVNAKKVFERVYKLHSSALGVGYKDDYKPVEVKERKAHLEVRFTNGDWLHYLPNGTWY